MSRHETPSGFATDSRILETPLTQERMLPLTDGWLGPQRENIDPPKDCGHLLPNDLVLVDPSAYTGNKELVWCAVKRISPGTAAVYPIQVSIPQSGPGQYALREVLGWARPVDIHRALMYARKMQGLPQDEEAAIDAIMST